MTVFADYNDIATMLAASFRDVATIPFWATPAAADLALFWNPRLLCGPDVVQWPLDELPATHRLDLVSDSTLERLQATALEALGIVDACDVVFSHLAINTTSGDVTACRPTTAPEGTIATLLVLPRSNAIGGAITITSNGITTLEWNPPMPVASWVAYYNTNSSVSVTAIEAGLRPALVFHVVSRVPDIAAVPRALRAMAALPHTTSYTAWPLMTDGELDVAHLVGPDRTVVDALVAAECFDIVLLRALGGTPSATVLACAVHPVCETPSAVLAACRQHIGSRLAQDVPMSTMEPSSWVVFWPKRHRVRVVGFDATMVNVEALSRGAGNLWGYPSVADMVREAIDVLSFTDAQLGRDTINAVHVGNAVLRTGDIDPVLHFARSYLCRTNHIVDHDAGDINPVLRLVRSHACQTNHLLDHDMAAWTLRALERFGWAAMEPALLPIIKKQVVTAPATMSTLLQRFADGNVHTAASIALIHSAFQCLLHSVRYDWSLGVSLSGELATGVLAVAAFLDSRAVSTLNVAVLESRLPLPVLGIIEAFARPPSAIDALLARIENLDSEAHLLPLVASAVLSASPSIAPEATRSHMERLFAVHGRHLEPGSQVPEAIAEVTRRLG